MKNIITYRLGIELTERCNLDCAHCFRGEARNINITREILEKVFSEVAYVEILDLSGGEVFLGYNELKMLLEIAKSKKTTIKFCSLFTNGTIYDKRIYDLLNEYFGDNYQIGISDDDFHQKSIARRYSKNKNPSSNPELYPSTVIDVYNNIAKHYHNIHCKGFYRVSNRLINNGRATLLDTPKKDFEAIGYYYDILKDNILLAGPLIFIGADGYISDINSDLTKREEQSLGNILDTPLSTCILNGGIKINCTSINDFFTKMQTRDNEFSTHQGDHLIFKNHKMSYVTYKPNETYFKALEDVPNVIENFRKALESGTMDEFFNYWDPIYDGDLSQIEHQNKPLL